MQIIDFSDYLKIFSPRKRKISPAYPLPVLSESETPLEVRLEFLANEVREIYSLIDQDLSKPGFIDFGQLDHFKKKLANLKISLTNYCDTVCSPSKHNKFNKLEKSGQQIFSELLQHLFMYISDKYPDNKHYINKFMGEVLTNHPSDFFYVFEHLETGERAISLWEDPMQEETALITVMRNGEGRVIDHLLANLRATFFNEQETITKIPTEFRDYLIHETTEGSSALSISYQRDNPAIRNSLLNFAESIYGPRGKDGFQAFAFQIDQHGTSSLMRASERGDLALVRLLLDGMRIIYGASTHPQFQRFLQYQDLTGRTVLNRASQKGKSKIVKQLLSTATIAFGGKSSEGFKTFLNLPNQEGVSPFISAAIHGRKKILKLLFETAEQAYGERSQALRQFVFRQDNAGYTALMRLAEHNQVGITEYSLHQLLTFSSQFEDSSNALYEALMLKTKVGGFSIFHLAAQSGSAETLTALLRGTHLFFDKDTPEFHAILSQQAENGLSPLDMLSNDEKEFRAVLEKENRIANSAEKITSAKRTQMIGEFLSYGLNPSAGVRFPHLRDLALHRSSWAHFFSIFCSRFRRSRRSTRALCQFDERDYKSLLAEPLQLRKEALVSLVAFMKQADLDSLAEVASIRNLNELSSREEGELQKYRTAVDTFYTEYSPQILRHFKQQASGSLEEAWNSLSAAHPYILLDNGIDLLVLSKEHLFSASLLNPAQAIDLRSELSVTDFKNWLDSYFGNDYTLHPFDPDVILQVYPDPLASLDAPIRSDKSFLSEAIQGISRKTIQALFLLDKKTISTSDFKVDDFFLHTMNQLTFRAENFHEVFFKLTLEEKQALKNLLLRQEFSAARYETLSNEENEYLSLYKAKLVEALRTSATESIAATDILKLAIEVQENFLDRESDIFTLSERQQIKTSLQQLKTGLTNSREKKIYAKAALQLIVLLFPNAVRGIVNKDPMEVLTPAGLIAADMGLRKLLIGFTKHPQVLKLFKGSLASKVLIMSEAAERVPIIGGAFALYGLYESGKILVATDKNDPNRPYYAHLFVNNLAMVGLMLAELATALPFWPVLTLFALLTIDQSLTEGRRIHDNDLHLTDDAKHPFSRFLTELELGLGIVTSKVELVETQRALFQSFLDYLDKIQTKDNLYSLLAVTLPEVQIEQTASKTDQGANFLEGTHKLVSQLTLVPAIDLGVQPQEVRRFRVVQKSDFNFVVKPQVFCESIDAYYLSSQHNYSLLTGKRVASAPQGLETDCEQGQERSSVVSAQASGTAGAAMLINKKINYNSTQKYPLLLAIDPAFVKTYRVNLHRINGQQAMPLVSQSSRSCAEDSIMSCIDTIVVNVAPIYAIPANTHDTTTIDIQTIGLANSASQDIRAIQYFLSITDKILIGPSEIANQTFVFSGKHDLRFEGDSIVSENSFNAKFGEAKVLFLVFNEKVIVQGDVPGKNRNMVISHLRGDQEQVAFFNATECRSFAASLGQQTEFKYKTHTVIIIAQNSSEILINAHAEGGAPPLYYFIKPLNQVSQSITHTNGVNLLLHSSDQSVLARVHLVTHGENYDALEPYIFSGHYRIDTETFYSRLIVAKNQNEKWGCALEIDASTGNGLPELDLPSLKKQNFSKVSVLTKEGDVTQLTHYHFCESKRLPKITGQFVAYELEEEVQSYVLLLRNAQGNEETQLFLLKENDGIVINNIHYKPNWHLFTLLAINGTEDLPIDGAHLLAPIKIEKAFNETMLTQEDGIFRINGIAVKNPKKLRLQFNDAQVPFSALAYRVAYQTKRNTWFVMQPVDSHAQDGRQIIESESRVLEKKIQSHGNSWKDIAYYSLTASASFLGVVGFALFSKRFRTQSVAATAVAIPLLEVPKIEAVPNKTFEPIWAEKYDVKFKEKLFNYSSMWLEYEDNTYHNETKGASHVFKDPFAELNSNIMLLQWVMHRLKGFLGSSTAPKKIDTKNFPANSASFFFNYKPPVNQSIASHQALTHR